MAKRGRVVRRGAVAAAPQKAVRRAVAEEEIEDLEDELEDVEEEDEEEDDAPAPRRVSRRVVDDETADIDDDDEEDEEDEEEDEEDEDEPAPVKVSSKRGVPAPKDNGKAPKAEKVAAPAPAPKAVAAQIKTVEQTVADNVLAQMFEALDDGAAIVITRVGANKWQIAKGDAVKLVAKKKTNSEAWQEMISPEYVSWNEEWVKKTYDQKKAYAKKLKVTWEPHEDPRIDVMRITHAVRLAEGIEKYKPEYRTRSARAAVRGG